MLTSLTAPTSSLELASHSNMRAQGHLYSRPPTGARKKLGLGLSIAASFPGLHQRSVFGAYMYSMQKPGAGGALGTRLTIYLKHVTFMNTRVDEVLL